MTITPHTRGLICVITATVLWSTAEVVVRTIVDEITPIQLATMRFSLGAAFLLVALPLVMRNRQLRFDRPVILHGLWIAIFGMFFTSLGLQFALKHAGAGIVAAVWGTNPLVVMALSALVLREPLTRSRSIGVTAGLLGIVILAMSKPSDTFSILGLMLAVVASSSFAFFTVFVKRFAGQYAGLPFTALCSGFGAMYLMPLMIIEGHTDTLYQFNSLWLPLLYLGIFPTGVSYLLFFTGLEHVDATQAASIIMLKPPLAAVLAAVWLGEPVTWNLVAAMALILGGLYLVIVAQRRQLPPEATIKPAPEVSQG